MIERLDRTNQNVMIFGNGYIEKYWTKRDLFIAMDCDNEKYTDTHQIQGGIHLWKKSDKSIKIAEEWLELVQNEHLLTNESSILGKPEHDGFLEHRHDQSIFSLICKKYNLIQSNYLLSDPVKYNISGTEKFRHILIPKILKGYHADVIISDNKIYIWFKRKFRKLRELLRLKTVEYSNYKNHKLSFRSKLFFFVYLMFYKSVKRLMLFLK